MIIDSHDFLYSIIWGAGQFFVCMFPPRHKFILINDYLAPISCQPFEKTAKRGRLTGLQGVDSEYGMRNSCCESDGGQGAVRKAMVIGGLLSFLVALFTCRGRSGPLCRVYFPSASIGSYGKRLNGAFIPSRPAAWPAIPGTMPIVPGSAVTPSRPPTAHRAAALPGPGRGCRTPGNPASWLVSGPFPWTLQDRFSPPAFGQTALNGTALRPTTRTICTRGGG